MGMLIRYDSLSCQYRERKLERDGRSGVVRIWALGDEWKCSIRIDPVLHTHTGNGIQRALAAQNQRRLQNRAISCTYYYTRGRSEAVCYNFCYSCWFMRWVVDDDTMLNDTNNAMPNKLSRVAYKIDFCCKVFVEIQRRKNTYPNPKKVTLCITVTYSSHPAV